MNASHPPEFGMNQLPLLEAQALLFERFGSDLHFRHECEYLTEALAVGERVLDVEGVGIGVHGTGILAITDRRLIHAKYRYLLRRFRRFVCEFERLDDVDVPFGRKSWSQIDVYHDDGRRTSLVLLHPRERAQQLCQLIADAAGLQ
jgi:hypothetical protein